MKKLLYWIIFASIPLTMIAQDQQKGAADKGLAKFKKLTTLAPFADNKFRGVDTSQLELGEPLQTSIISLDKLKDYKAGNPASSSITDIGELVYPVINGKDKSPAGNLTISKSSGQWRTARYNAEPVLLSDTAKGILASRTHIYKLVKILVFHVNFLSYTEGSTLMLIPLQNDRGRELYTGRPVTAEIVLEKYVSAAQHYNGLPL